jgi:hypothetical protein
MLVSDRPFLSKRTVFLCDFQDSRIQQRSLNQKNESEIKRQVTDKNGFFNFEEPRPGRWRLKIYSHNLPEHHYLDRNRLEFQLEPCRGKEVSVKVLPKEALYLDLKRRGDFAGTKQR